MLLVASPRPHSPKSHNFIPQKRYLEFIIKLAEEDIASHLVYEEIMSQQA